MHPRPQVESSDAPGAVVDPGPGGSLPCATTSGRGRRATDRSGRTERGGPSAARPGTHRRRTRRCAGRPPSRAPDLDGAALDGAPVSRPQLGLQGSLFDDLPEAERPGAQPAGIGYRGPTAYAAAGITYRQLDYWARTGLVEPSVREAAGSGTQRLYSFRDILVLKVVKKLLDAGRLAAEHPHGDRHPARPRRGGPRPDHADERRHHRLRVHLHRRGPRPAAGRPGGLRHRHRAPAARRAGLAGRSCRGSAPRRPPHAVAAGAADDLAARRQRRTAG